MSAGKRDAEKVTGPGAENAPGRAPVVLAAALFSVMLAYVLLRVPLGIPGEWTTSYHARFAGAAEIAAFAVALAAFLAAARLFDGMSPRLGRARAALPVAALTVLYAGVLFTSASCGPYGRAEFPAPVIMSDSAGFFQREAEKVTDAAAYLRDFPRTLEEYSKDYRATVRVNNNPPGATMVFYAAMKIARAYPGVSDLAAAAVFGAGFKPPTARTAASVLGAWFLLLGAALSFVPACLVARRMAGGAAFLPAAAAVLAGSMLLFIPNNDTLQVFFFLWMLYFFVRGRDGRSAVWGAALGLAATVALFFSLAAAVVVVVLFACSLADATLDGRGVLKRRLVFWLASAGSLAAGFLALYLATGYNSLTSLLVCYGNHAAFYDYFPRTYWKWALFNPWDFLLFLGPLAATVVYAAAKRPQIGEVSRAIGPESLRAWVIATVAVMVLLDLTGKNLSEVNRLWVFFMPLLTLPACVRIWREKAGTHTLLVLAALQGAYVILLRVLVQAWPTETLFREMAVRLPFPP